MKTSFAAQLLVIYVNSSDQYQARPLYSAIIRRCEELGIAGATVVRCDEGYGAHHTLHTLRLLGLTQDLPVRIEIIDTPPRIREVLQALDGMLSGGLVTVQDVQVHRYSPDASA